MSFLVVSGTMLTCSYGTCSSKLKVTALALPDMSVELTLPSMDLGLGLGFGVDLSLPHGLFKKFDIHGNLAFQMNFDMGIMVGEYLAFDIMGRITQRLMFIGGKLYGMASLYAEGVLTAAINFEAGLMHGMSKFYDMYGRLAIQTNFNMGLEDGLRITFDVEIQAPLTHSHVRYQDVVVTVEFARYLAVRDLRLGIPLRMKEVA